MSTAIARYARIGFRYQPPLWDTCKISHVYSPRHQNCCNPGACLQQPTTAARDDCHRSQCSAAEFQPWYGTGSSGARCCGTRGIATCGTRSGHHGRSTRSENPGRKICARHSASGSRDKFCARRSTHRAGRHPRGRAGLQRIAQRCQARRRAIAQRWPDRADNYPCAGRCGVHDSDGRWRAFGPQRYQQARWRFDSPGTDSQRHGRH